MFCRCTHCHTSFAVNAAQLRAGRGRVRCGTCLTVFDALETLSEQLSELDTPEEAVAERSATSDAPAAERPAPTPPADIEAAPESIPATATGDVRAAVPDDDDRPQPALGDISRVSAVAESAPEQEQQAVPDVLREDMERLAASRQARRTTMLFGSGVALLVCVLVAQWAWFEPADVLARYPQARTLMEQFCERAGCVLPERRDATKVRMVTRDVRVHPRYEGALRVTASLLNTAPYTQPFPRLQFTLFNVNGQVIASRIFEPREYLPEDVEVAAEMRPRVPVQVALELLAPEDAAVSFEFDFL